MPRELVRLRVDQIAGVDNPATGKKFLVIKREEASNKGGVNDMTLEELLAKIEDEEIRKELAAQIEELQKEPEGVDGVDEGEDVNKIDIPEAVQKRLDEMEKRAEEAQKLAEEEREKRLEVEFSKRARQYDAVAEVDKIKSVLQKSAGMDNDLCEDLEEILASAQERLEKSELFEQSGDSGQDVTDSESVLEKKAEEIRSQNPDLTEAQAVRKAVEENQSLYLDYRKENSNE